MTANSTRIEIGRLLRAGTAGFVVGCRVSQVEAPSFGALVSVPQNAGYEIFGLVHDIHIDDDGLVRQLVTAEGVQEGVIADNRVNRNVPLEISVLLPPRPPLSLDQIYLCGADEICQFTSAGHFGYFRHVLRAQELPVGELLAAHFQQAGAAHLQAGEATWAAEATQELIILLRDDYPALMAVLSALRDLVKE
jgi:hypothetical protein